MKKIKNSWLNGFFRAWEMLFYFAIDEYFARFVSIDKSKCRGSHILTGMLFSAFAAGLILMFFSWILTSLVGGVPGAVVSTLAVFLLLILSDHGSGITAATSMVEQKISGKKLSDILPAIETDPHEINSGIASAVFAVLLILKLAVIYVIMFSGNFHLLIMILLAGAFTQAFVLNSHTGGGAFFGFINQTEKNIFYICAIIMLLVGTKFNLMSALAFLGGIFLWNFWLQEKFIKLPGGKSDGALTFYGECAVFISSIIAFIYSAGNLSN